MIQQGGADPQAAVIGSDGDVIYVYFMRPEPGDNVSSYSIGLVMLEAIDSRYQHQRSVTALQLGIVSSPTPAAQT
jgi:hypothetical protein